MSFGSRDNFVGRTDGHCDVVGHVEVGILAHVLDLVYQFACKAFVAKLLGDCRSQRDRKSAVGGNSKSALAGQAYLDFIAGERVRLTVDSKFQLFERQELLDL